MISRYCNRSTSSRSIYLRFFAAATLALFVLLGGALGTAGTTHAQTVYHVTETGDASNDGSSFSDGDALSLQGALSMATGSDVIVIAAGRYVPTSDASDRDARFEITGTQDGLKIYGGWSGDESFSDIDDVEDQRSNRGQAENLTVLSGDIEGNDNTNAQGITEEADDINGANSKTVVYLDGTTGGNITTDTVLDGLVITGGQADRGGGFEDTTGGGAFCNGGSGGNCSPVISNTRFIGNTASGNGGAIYNRTTSGGTSSPQIINSTFTGNRAGDRGGAINNFGFNGTSSPQITNSTFTGNSAGVRGGAINNFKFDEGASSPTVVNSIFWDNSADDDDDDIEIFNNTGASVMLSHTLIKGGCGSITNASCDGTNLAADPDFVNVNDPSGNGLLLLTTSPALDAGDNTPFETGGIAEDIETDLLGEARIQNGTVSVGAYERGINNEAQLRLVARSGVETGTFELSNTGIGVFGAEVDLGNLPPGVSAIDDSGDGDVNNDGDTWTVDVLAGGTATVRIDYERGASADPGLLNLTAELNTNSYTVDDGGVDGTDPSDAIVDWALLEAPYGSGTALAFDGTNDGATAEAHPDLSGNAPWTIAFWAKVDGSASGADRQGWYLWKGSESQSENRLLGIAVTDQSIEVAHWGNDNTYAAGVAFDTWQHVAVTYDGAGTEKVYLGGVFQDERDVGTLTVNDGAWSVAQRPDGTDRLQVELDELRMWTEARSEADIQATMHQTLPADTPDLVASYRFDAAQTGQRFDDSHSGLTAYDLTGGRDAAFEGAPQWTASGAPLGQESVVINVNGTGAVGPTNAALTVTTTDAPVTLYRYGDASAEVFDDEEIPRGQRSNAVWGAVPTGMSDLELTYGDVTVPNPSAVGLVERPGPTQPWTARAEAPSGETFTLTGQTSAREFALYDNATSILYVDAAASGTGTGASWDDAYPDLEDALSAAVGGDVIVIAAGTYTPSARLNASAPRTATFEVTGEQDGLRIYGGWSGSETFTDVSEVDAALDSRDLVANETILSGNINGDESDESGNAYHVIVLNGGDAIGADVDANLTPDTVLDGVTITGGNADENNFPRGAGGGLYCDAQGSGNACSPSLTGLTFAGNSAAIRGGAIYNNGRDSGTSSPQIVNTIFTGNSADSQGGAIYNGGFSGTSSPVVTNATFTGNSAGEGGAIYSNGFNGGESSSVLTNVTFTGNSADSQGGAIYNDGRFSGTSSPQITNTILWGNTAGDDGNEIYNRDATPILAHTLIEGGLASISENDGSSTTDGGNNLDADPLFVDADNPAGDDGILGTADDGLRFEPGSSVLNAGDNSAIPAGITTDLIGEDRIQGGTVSLGAYERGNFTKGPLFFVDESASGGDGSSFEDGLSDLQYALDVATGGDVILIAAGTYTPSARLDASDARTATFEVAGAKDGLKIYGGWSGSETFTDVSEVEAALDSRDLSANETILSGNINDDESDDLGNAYHVVVLNGGASRIGINSAANITTDTVLDGLTITGGNADGNFSDSVGGGLVCDGERSGNACSPLLNRLTFTGNAANTGGAIYNNGRDGGASNPVIVNTIFIRNSVDGPAGSGGAIYNSGFDGGESSPQVTNATFTGNTAGDRGGAIYNAAGRGGMSNPVVTNTISWGNAAPDGNEIYNREATPTLAHTLIKGGLNGSGVGGDAITDGGNNLDADPLFADADAGDVRLTPGSPAIARGTFAPFESGGVAEGITTDLAGDNRLFGAKPDLGAFTFNDIATTDNDIADAAGLLGYLEPTGFEGLVLLRENSAANGGLAFDRTGEAPDDPSGELPDNVAPFTWTVTSDLDTAPSYDLLLSTSDIGGISDFDALTLYKSEDGGQTWDAVDTFSGASLVLDEGRALVAVQDLVGFSQFAIGSSDAGNPLPVELAGFEAQRSGPESVTVQWQTLSETDNAGFEVQRAVGSADGPVNGSVNGSVMETPGSDVSTGGTWETIARLNGAGTTDAPQSYRFEDAHLPYAADSLSYRLRQVDTGGTASFSETVTIARQVTQAELLPTYPNPARSQATVRFAVPERQAVRIDLYDLLGRRVQTVVNADAEGRTEQVLDVSRLASGTYFLRMQTTGHTETQRVTVVR